MPSKNKNVKHEDFLARAGVCEWAQGKETDSGRMENESGLDGIGRGGRSK